MASYSSDTLPTCIEYHSADLYDTYTMYNPADIRWDVLSDIMSVYYLHIYRIFGLKGLWVWPGWQAMMCAARLYLQMLVTVLESLGCTQSSQMTGMFVQGVVLDPLRADVYVIPENSGHVEAILNAP